MPPRLAHLPWRSPQTLCRIRRHGPWVSLVLASMLAALLHWDLGSRYAVPGLSETPEVSVAPLVTGRVARVDVQPGQTIAAGDIVASLETSALEAEIAIVTADLERLRAAAVPQRADWLEPMQRLSDEAEAAAVELAQLRADAAASAAELEQVERQITRQETLLTEHLVTSERLDELFLRRAALRGEVERQPELIRQAERHRDAAQRRLRELSGAGTAGESADSDWLAPSRLAVGVQERRLDQLRQERDQATLRSPIDGCVGTVLLRPGDVTGPQAPVLTIVGHATDQVVAYVEETRAARLRTGEPVRLRTRDRTGLSRTGTIVSLGAAIVELPARLRRIPSRPSYGREVRIRLLPDPPTPLPCPGELFHVSFEAGESSLLGPEAVAAPPAREARP